MLDMKSTGQTFARLSIIVTMCVVPLASCKTLSLGKDKTASIETDETVAEASPSKGEKPNTSARSAAHTGAAYVDPYVTANGTAPALDSPPQTLPGSEEPAANIGGMVTQPTGIKAYQSSIFSSGAAPMPEAPPQGPDGAVLPPSAYGAAPGVNATLYSVYGKGRAATGAISEPLE